ncbi:helix-turn-helix domain-containing protein [Kitasatospora sp. NPDC059673]|uniref:helix-turn-helix domain-containing protein n=1 Tax=Kitasatospora sp. NPDC059673 TaxID=3346901 RepID=UPI003675274E
MSVRTAAGCGPGAAGPRPPAGADPAGEERPGERVVRSRVGYLRIATLEAQEAQPARIAGRPARGAPEPMAGIGVQVSGSAVLTQDGRRTVLGPGELVLFDTGRPYTVEYPEPFRAHLFHLPRRLLAVPAGEWQQVTGVAVTAADGFGSVLLPFLETLAGSAHCYSGPVADRLAGSVADLVGTLVAELAAACRTEAYDTPNDHLVRRVRGHIERHLADPDLSPETIARAHHISVRYLHRLFEGEEVTVSRLILRARLDACAQELSRRGPSGPSVSAVAQRWGFASPTHFSRAFRAAYGVSPREWRGRRAVA